MSAMTLTKQSTLRFMNRIPVVSYRFYCKEVQSSDESETKKEPKVPRNILKDTYSAATQKENGVIAGKAPFRIKLEKGKKYAWCLCGQSHNQPFCDGTHKNIFLKINFRPILFAVDETKDYWLCTCKQTKNRPFCDGTHKRPDIQEMRF